MLLRAKPRCWLWGLLPLLLVGLLVAVGTKGVIEKDLEKRSTVALRAAGYGWAIAKFQGLDGRIQGQAPSDGERLKAVRLVENIWGVRVVTDKLSLSPVISPFSWSASHRKGRVKLRGYVPSSKVRKSIVGLVTAKFPNAKLDDKLKIANGVKDESKWFGQVSFGLSQLALMRTGDLNLSDDKFSLAGPAIDRAGYTLLQSLFKGALPLGLVQDSVSILPPLEEEYVFSANFDTKILLLEGLVGDAAFSNRLEQAASTRFPNIIINNKLILGSGAPKGWSEALMLSLLELSKLSAGTVTLQQRDVKIEGVADDETIARGVRSRVRSAYPTGYKVSDVITIKEPDVPLLSPFELSIFDDGSEVIIDGAIETKDKRQAILDAVRAKMPGRSIVDKSILARGAVPKFNQAILVGVASMVGLEHGRLILHGDTLSLSGIAPSAAAFKQYSNRPDGLPADIIWNNEVRYDGSEARAKAEAFAKIQAAAEASRVATADAKRKAAAFAKIQADAEASRRAASAKAASVRAKADADAKVAAEKEAAVEAQREVTSAQELAQRRNWLSRAETEKRLQDLYKESGAVNAKECQLLMNSIVRGSAIRFGVNSSVINPSSFDVLSKVQSVANKCTNTVIRIEGHTDSDGSGGYNLELSKRRARAVIAYLIGKNIPSQRLDAKGYGEKKPVASNGTASGKALNRRIEFIVFEN